MSLLTSDLSRNFGIGFVLGAVIVGLQIMPISLAELPQAIAAIVVR